MHVVPPAGAGAGDARSEHRAFSDAEGGPILTLRQDHWETADAAR